MDIVLLLVAAIVTTIAILFATRVATAVRSMNFSSASIEGTAYGIFGGWWLALGVGFLWFIITGVGAAWSIAIAIVTISAGWFCGVRRHRLRQMQYHNQQR